MAFRLACIVAALLVRSMHGDGLQRPVAKVVDLLQGMLETLESEQKEDEEVYDGLACWCQTNEKDKTQAITDANIKEGELKAEIQSLSSHSEELTAEIEYLTQQVQEETGLLEAATKERKSEHDAFIDKSKDLSESIVSLKAAIVVLSEFQGGTFLQGNSNQMMSAAATIQDQLRRHERLLKGVLTPLQRRKLAAFAQSQSDPWERPEYDTQSGDVYKTLQEMLASFEKDLSDSEQAEADQKETYETLDASKKMTIKSHTVEISDKNTQRAETNEDTVMREKELKDTQNSRSADEQYLAMVNQRCSDTDAEWEERQATRRDEIEAVSQAMQILTSDDARDTFARTYAVSFLQESAARNSNFLPNASALLASMSEQVGNPKMTSVAMAVKRNEAPPAPPSRMLTADDARDTLASMAEHVRNPKMASLAIAVERNENFTEVIAAIDDMVSSLTGDKDAEIKHKDACVTEFSQNEMDTAFQEDQKEKHLTAIDAREYNIETLSKEIEHLSKSNDDMELELTHAKENRERESQVFHTTLADQQETQRLLKEASKVLEANYATTTVSFITTRQEPADMPEGFDKYEEQKAPGVIGLINRVIHDTEVMESDTTRAEEDAQKAYEDFVKGTNGEIKANSGSMADKEDDKLATMSKLDDEQQSLESTQGELDGLSDDLVETHASCDFLMKNFDLRQTAYSEELEALRQAKAILLGSGSESAPALAMAHVHALLSR